VHAVLPVPAGFDFRRTVFSHGWISLAPFRLLDGDAALATTVTLPAAGALPFRVQADVGGVGLEAPGRLAARERRFVIASARRVLNLDLDLEPFYCRVRERPEMAWIADTGAGRLLRCPTLFEDLIKLVLTTNCSWSLTQRMVGNLIDLYGETAQDGSKAFPRPEAIAGAGTRALRERVRTGYRAPLLARLARLVADGRVEPDSWERDARGPEELRREMLELPGVGPYVAENLLRMLGRPAGLALDSWIRTKYARIHHRGTRVTDRTIARRYARLGPWGGLALWCEMTRDWLEKPDVRFTG
jgi:N-glycosylase/DNA lyase